MCNFVRKIIDENTVIDYKVAYKVDDKYYSIITGMEYTVGLIKPVIRYGKTI